MDYNFSSVAPRFEVGSNKWREIRKVLPGFHGDIIPFSVADMEFETAPEIREGLKTYIDSYIMGYANPTEAFMQAVCGWMTRRFSWHIEPDWIVSSHGIVDAFFTAVRAYTEPGEGVILMTPTYYPMYSAISSNGRRLLANPLINKDGRYEIDWVDFERKAREPDAKLLILCSPHNPSGRVWTLDELIRIGRICIDNGVVICSDEIHFDIVMPGFHHTVFANISDEFANHSLVCTAPSKSFNLAGLQTSNIIIPNQELRNRFIEVLNKGTMFHRCNVLGYEANRIAYEQCERWLEQCLSVIDHNRKLVETFIAREIPDVRITPLEGTYLLWMDFRALGIDFRELARIMKEEAQLFFDDGYLFGMEGEGFERWNLACPTRYVEEGLERMKKALLNR